MRDSNHRQKRMNLTFLDTHTPFLFNHGEPKTSQKNLATVSCPTIPTCKTPCKNLHENLGNTKSETGHNLQTVAEGFLPDQNSHGYGLSHAVKKTLNG
jgi:hypothetical protein